MNPQKILISLKILGFFLQSANSEKCQTIFFKKKYNCSPNELEDAPINSIFHYKISKTKKGYVIHVNKKIKMCYFIPF